MVDLSKHLKRIRESIDRRSYDVAIESALQCQEIDPSNTDLYKLLIEAAKKKVASAGRPWGLGSFSLTSDPQKKLTALCKQVGKDPNLKNLKAAGDAALASADSGMRTMFAVAILFFDEARNLGDFDETLWWDSAHAWHGKFQAAKDRNSAAAVEALETGIGILEDMLKHAPKHADANRTISAWQATRAGLARKSKDGGTGFRSQLANDQAAQDAELLGMNIKTKEDAKKVIGAIDRKLKENPEDRDMWQKRGDVLKRVKMFDKALESFQKAQELDPHNFVVTMRIGDARMEMMEHKIRVAQEAGHETTGLETELLNVQEEEYRSRQAKQPTDLSHAFKLGQVLMRKKDVDGAAQEFQKSARDPKYRRESAYHLGKCFTKKGVLGLAIKQFTACLDLHEDEHDPQAKEVLYLRGRIYEKTKKTDEAVDDYTRLVEIDLGYRDAADRLGKLAGADDILGDDDVA